MTIGERIKGLRIANNLTQNQLAEKVMVTQQMNNRIENDLTKPGIDLAKRLAESFGCTIDELCK